MNKETWTDDILQSARAIQKVEANPYLASRIEARLQQPVAIVRELSRKWVYSVAAGMLLLSFINIAAWRRASHTTGREDGLQQVIREYGWSTGDLYSANLQLRRHE